MSPRLRKTRVVCEEKNVPGEAAAGRPALSPTKAALRDRLLLKIAQTAGIRVIREGTEAIAASAARAQGEARMNAMRRRKLKPHEWFVASAADYARLASQVGTLWHERGNVDAYYLDGAVFVCKKRRVHGDFEVLDVFSTDVSYEEFESRRRRAHEEVVYADAGDYSSFTRRLRNALGRDNGGADGVENGRAAADSGLGLADLAEAKNRLPTPDEVMLGMLSIRRTGKFSLTAWAEPTGRNTTRKTRRYLCGA